MSSLVENGAFDADIDPWQAIDPPITMFFFAATFAVAHEPGDGNRAPGCLRLTLIDPPASDNYCGAVYGAAIPVVAGETVPLQASIRAATTDGVPFLVLGFASAEDPPIPTAAEPNWDYLYTFGDADGTWQTPAAGNDVLVPDGAAWAYLFAGITNIQGEAVPEATALIDDIVFGTVGAALPGAILALGR